MLDEPLYHWFCDTASEQGAKHHQGSADTDPPTIALNVLASMHNSWTQWIQTQGRYLFPLLLPLALLMGGTIEFEPRWLRTSRLLGMLVSFVLSLYVLWFVVLQDTGLLF